MAQTIKLKRSATAGGIPTTSQLELGEVAINTTDGKMYIKKSVSGVETIVDITGGGSSADTILEEFQFTATSNQTTFSGSDDNSETFTYTPNAIQVFLNGILLDYGVDYTATNGTSVVLAETVDANDYLQVFAFKQKISDGSVSVNTFTGNGSTTAFTLSINPGDENNTRVFVDGVYQSKSNYAVSGTTLTFSTAPPTGTAIEVEIGNRNVTLDTTANLDLPDDVKLRLGTGQDLQIYSDGTYSYIEERNTTSGLKITSDNQVAIRKHDNENIALFNVDGAVHLYHDNAQKFSTTSTGLQVTGNIANASGDFTLDVAGTIKLDADSGTFYFQDAGTIFGIVEKAGTSMRFRSGVQDGDIIFMGNDSGSLITALTLDMSNAGAATFSSSISTVGAITGGTLSAGTGSITGGSLNVDNISINSSSITSSSNLNLTSSNNDIILDTGQSDIILRGSGSEFGRFFTSSNNFYIKSAISNADLIIQGNDGGVSTTVLTFDMSDGGAAHFGNDIFLSDNRAVRFGNQQDFRIYNDGNHTTFHNASTNHDMIFKGSDDGAPINALTLDMSNAGKATFSGIVNSPTGFERGNLFITQNEIDVSSGNLTLDVAGEIILDSDAEIVRIYHDGGWVGGFQLTNNDFIIRSAVSDKDLIFKGNDGGSTITALTLDMSDAGAATFNNHISLGDNKQLKFGASNDVLVEHNASNNNFQITNYNTSGGMVLQNNGSAGGIALQPVINENAIYCAPNGAVQLYHNGSSKLQTTATGITVSETSSGNLMQVASFVNPVGTANTGVRLWLSGTNTTTRGTFIDAIAESSANDHSLRFGTSINASAPIERMRIEPSGTIAVSGGGASISPTIKHSGVDAYLSKLRLVNRSGQSSNKGGLLELGGVTNDEVTRSDVFASLAGLKSTSTSNNRTGYMQFSTNSGSALVEHMRIDSSGKVGIGTSSPNAFLSVRKDNNNSGNQFVVADTEGTSPGVRTYTHGGDDSGLILNHYYALGGGGNEYMRYADFVANVGNGAGTTMRFITKNAANTFTVGLAQDNNGNVGIGTTAPSQKLHVSGRIKSNDGLLSNAFQVYNTGTSGFLIELDIASNDYAHIHGTIKLQQFNVSSQQIINFSATTLNNGTVQSSAATADIDVTIKLFVYNSKWYVHVPSPSTYSDISAYIHLGAGYQGGSRGSNCIIGISSAGVPSSGVSGSVDIVAQKRILANTAGKVGIGQPVPTSLLEVKGANGAAGIRLTSPSGLGSALNINGSGYGEFYLYQAGGNPKVGLQANGTSYFLGGDITVGHSAGAGIGGNPADLNYAEVGPGFIRVNRDDTADAAQLSFGKNGAVHSYLETRTNGLGFITNVGNFAFEGGNVGIGTTNPGAALDVERSSGWAEVHLNGASGGDLILQDNGVNIGEIYAGVGHGMVLKSFASQDMHFLTNANATAKMTLDTSGRLGIGQTPLTNNFALQVTGMQSNGTDARVMYLKGAGTATSIGSTGPTLVLQNTNSTANNIVKLSFESASSGETVSINAINTNHSSHYGDMAFNTRGSGGYSEKMRIMANGNVGIGTESSSYKLALKDNSASAYPLSLESGTIGTPGNHTGIRFGFTGNTYQKGAIIFEGQDANGRGKMYFAMEGSANSSNADETDAKMTIDYSGKVGIGISNPSETLELTRLGKIGFGMNGNYGARIGYFDDGSGTHGFHIDTKHGGTTVSESRFVVRADSGNVGIGTKNPSYLVHAQNLTATGPSYIATSANNQFIMAIGSQNSPGVAQEAFVGTLSDTRFKIKVNNTVKGSWTDNGLAIGTQSSAYTNLDVAGQIAMSVGNAHAVFSSDTSGKIFIKANENKVNAATAIHMQMPIVSGSGSLEDKLVINHSDITAYEHFLPSSDNTYDLGTAAKRWRNIYTGDLHLSNETQKKGNDVDGTKGNWTVQEGEENLYLINNKTGKKYKFALEEIE